MDDAVNHRPEMTPISKASSSKGFQSKRSSPTVEISDDDEESGPKPKRRHTSKSPEWVVQMLRSQDKRHKERMDGHTKMCSILEKFLDKF